MILNFEISICGRKLSTISKSISQKTISIQAPRSILLLKTSPHRPESFFELFKLQSGAFKYPHIHNLHRNVDLLRCKQIGKRCKKVGGIKFRMVWGLLDRGICHHGRDDENVMYQLSFIRNLVGGGIDLIEKLKTWKKCFGKCGN